MYHFIRDYVQRGAVMLQYISTDEQVADILTKSLGRGKFVFFRDKLGVVQKIFLGKSSYSSVLSLKINVYSKHFIFLRMK